MTEIIPQFANAEDEVEYLESYLISANEEIICLREKVEHYKKGFEAVKRHLETIGECNGMKPTAYSITCDYLNNA